jgi:tRNA(Ile)-lysidine synthase
MLRNATSSANCNAMRGGKPEAAIEQTVERDGVIKRGDRVVIACSGGVDSVALAGVLDAVRGPMELDLTLAYVHHGTRRSAWQDECIVLRLGATFGVPVRVAALRGEAYDEASMRAARYQALVAIARERGATTIATAHHCEDQSETVLLALFRGAGPDGIAAMPARRRLDAGIDLVRPLLRVTTGDLRRYCHARGLPYAVDPTNADAGLRRNAVRSALDALRPLFPGLDAAISRSAEIIGAERSGSGRADLRRRVREVLNSADDLRDVDFEHVEAAVRALERGGSGRFFMKPGVELRIERGTIASIVKE